MPAHVKSGDSVIVTSGDFKGVTGKVKRVIPDKQRVIVEGVNLVTRHMRPSKANPQGGVMSREAAIHMSKVSPVVDGKPSRVRFSTKKDGSKVRVAARGGGELSVVRNATSTKSSTKTSSKKK